MARPSCIVQTLPQCIPYYISNEAQLSSRHRLLRNEPTKSPTRLPLSLPTLPVVEMFVETVAETLAKTSAKTFAETFHEFV